MKKWEIVLLLIAAIVTVIGLVIWIPVAICCKCVASQLIMGYKARGGGGVFVDLQYAYREPTHSHTIIIAIERWRIKFGFR